MDHKKFRVAICGGGVGGITCALTLSKHPDIDLDVYEAAASFSPVGAGITVWPRTWSLLKQMGLAEELAKVAARPPTDEDTLSFHYRKSNQQDGVDFLKLMSKGRMLTIHRADFHRILLSRLPDSCRTHTSKRLHSYSQLESGTIKLTFEDGSCATCDVLVGADGIKSRVRGSFLQEKAREARIKGNLEDEKMFLASIEPVWSGSVTYRSLVSAEQLRTKNPNHRALSAPMQYTGDHAHVVAYPVSQGNKINVAAYYSRYELRGTKYDGPWAVDKVDDEFRGVYAGWEPEVQEILECIDKPMRWAVHIVEPLMSFVSGRVAIIGDAAHAMVPHQGSGGGQAVEDAVILATLLGHPFTTIDSISRALRIYDEIRQPFANDIARRSLQCGKWFCLQYKGVDFNHCSEEEMMQKLHELGNDIFQVTEWAWASTLDSALENALKMLEDSARAIVTECENIVGS